MRIGIDARMLGPQNSGLGRYVQALVEQLLMMDADNEYILFLKKENWNAVPDQSSTYTARYAKVLADIPWYGWREQIFFPSVVKRAQVDLMHFPHWNVPLWYRAPFVVTIHDLIMFHYPRAEASTHGRFVYWLKDQLSRVVVRHAARSARHVLVTSQWVKEDVHATLGVALERMTVTYQAPMLLSGEHTSQRTKNILNKYQIKEPYVLYVGNAFPHKNLEGLLAAWHVIEERYGMTHQLVLVGRNNYFYSRLVASQAMKQCQRVRYTDFIPDSDLSAVYRHASLYVFPSLEEGFGLPPLEAMMSEIPVVSSNRSCLPEVLKDAVVYADPTRREEFAAAIWQTLQDQELRHILVQKGKKLTQSYSWETLARQTMPIYQKYSA